MVQAVFVDFPEALASGASEAEALRRARELLEAVLTMYMQEKHELPVPTLRPDLPSVTLSILGGMKVALYREMRRQKVTKAELARRLQGHVPQVDRLLDLAHASRLDQMEQAFRALGSQLRVLLEPLTEKSSGK